MRAVPYFRYSHLSLSFLGLSAYSLCGLFHCLTWVLKKPKNVGVVPFFVGTDIGRSDLEEFES